MDDKTLVEALRAAGHEDYAKGLQIEELKKQAAALGRDDVVELLEGKGTLPAEAEPAKPKTADQMHGEAVARVLKRDTGRDFGEAA